ncbi:MAG: hypothetical protein GTO35_13850 [Gammaproteobacteria bacterium]|nr:hypothetical protein [Gammaproteobacteria bacterium]
MDDSHHMLSAMKTNAWLGQMNAEKYVLQLIAANQVSTLASYINATGIPVKDMAWFKTRQADKPWFVLVYGLYGDIESARAATVLLPEQAKSLNPWPRKMGEIQIIME